MRDVASVDISIELVNDDRGGWFIDGLTQLLFDPTVVPSSAVREPHLVDATAALDRPALIGESMIGADLAVRTPISINRLRSSTIPW